MTPDDFRHACSALPRVGGALAACALVVAVGTAAALGVPSASLSASAEHAAQIDGDVWSQVHSGRRASVIVALSIDTERIEERSAQGAWADRGAVAEDTQIEATQQRVLASLPTGSFRLTHRYVHVAALGGTADQAAIDALRRSPEVVAVSLDPSLKAHLADVATFIGTDRLRRQRVTGEGVGIAVLDTGVDTGSVDLRDAIVAEACFLTPRSLCPDEPHLAEDADGHGTSVSAIALSRGKKTDHGIASAADLIAVKLIEERNNAAGTELVAALDWLVARDDVDVVNMSIGGGRYKGECDTASAYTRSLAGAVRRLRAKGIIAVASSGNDGSPTTMGAPACVADVISVGAIEGHAGNDPKLAVFTNRNDTLDILAPGSGIATTSLAGRETTFGGTSAAAPVVAGAVALLLGEVPWATQDQIEDALKSTVQRPTIRYGDITIGTIRVDRALTQLRKIEPPATPSPLPSPTPTASPTETPTATHTAVSPTATEPQPPPSSSPTQSAASTATLAPSVTPTAATPQSSATSGSSRTPAASPVPPDYTVWLPAAHRP